MTREEIIETYMINSKKVIAEMLHDTIQRYESITCETCIHYDERDRYCSLLKAYNVKFCGKWESK